jgi:hypothetical protein
MAEALAVSMAGALAAAFMAVEAGDSLQEVMKP